MQFNTLLALLPVFLASTLVSAHGIVVGLNAGGTAYTGPRPSEGQPNPGDGVIRQVLNNGPVAADSAELGCGRGSKPATQQAPVNPGDTVTFDWGSWPHRVGPIITYMANCGSTTCDKFDAASAKWFKIDQQGKVNGQWVQAGVADGQDARVTIPQNLAPGNYLMRHEIIALHNGQSRGGAEFYPSCSQLTVGGSGTAVPAASELVSFPGAYSADHPGIHVTGLYDGGDYTFPGPAVAKLAGGGGSPASPPAATTVNNGGNGPTTTQSPPATPTKAKGKVCKVRKSRTVSPASSTAGVFRRAHSRVFRRLASASHSH